MWVHVDALRDAHMDVQTLRANTALRADSDEAIAAMRRHAIDAAADFISSD